MGIQLAHRPRQRITLGIRPQLIVTVMATPLERQPLQQTTSAIQRPRIVIVMVTRLVQQDRIRIILGIPILPILIRMVTREEHRQLQRITLAIPRRHIKIAMARHRALRLRLLTTSATEIQNSVVTTRIQRSGAGSDAIKWLFGNAEQPLSLN